MALQVSTHSNDHLHTTCKHTGIFYQNPNIPKAELDACSASPVDGYHFGVKRMPSTLPGHVFRVVGQDLDEEIWSLLRER